MKKVLMIAAVMALTFSLTTPLLAKPRDHYRGHGVRGGRGGHHHGYSSDRGYYAPYPRYRHQSRLFFGFGLPLFAPAPVYYYAPVYYPPAYAYYAPEPILAPRGYGRAWVPGHYSYDRGTRFWIAGAWSYSR